MTAALAVSRPMTPDPHLELLRRVELFRQLDDDELTRLAGRFVEQVVPSRTLVYKHGDTADSFYVVRDGSVSVYRDQTGKPLHLLARLEEGDFFGVTGLFDGYRRSASARTSATTRLAKISKDDLLAFLDQHPAVAVKLQIAAARRHTENVAAALDLGERRDVRIRLQEPVRLIDEDGTAHPVVLENLSVGGLCLRGEMLRGGEPWARGATASFSLSASGDELPVTARVSWREEERAGFAFLGADDGAHDERVECFLRTVLA